MIIVNLNFNKVRNAKQSMFINMLDSNQMDDNMKAKRTYGKVTRSRSVGGHRLNTILLFINK